MQTAKETNMEVKTPAKGRPAWRKLSLNDMENLVRVANIIHPDLPESIEVFSERVKLFPEGCLALVANYGGREELCGYVISHPIIRRRPPPLNSLLGEISPAADQYYIHDLAIMPNARGLGLAQVCMDEISTIAARFSTTCLVSVYGSASFWGRFGFAPGGTDYVLEQKLRDYGDDAIYLERSNEDWSKYESRTKTET